MAQCHLDVSDASVLNLRDETVRVFSDGVPERDFREGASSRFYAGRKLTTKCIKTKAMQRLDVETSSGHEG